MRNSDIILNPSSLAIPYYLYINRWLSIHNLNDLTNRFVCISEKRMAWCYDLSYFSKHFPDAFEMLVLQNSHIQL